MTDLFNAIRCEWLKRRRSLAAWLIVVGALFTPALVVAVRLVRREQLGALYAAPDFWTSLWRSSWESMAIFFLPMAAILATSLVVQIEVRNNAWKQVHALPLRPLMIYAAKFAVIVLMMAQFMALFVAGVWLSALLPSLLVAGVPHPVAPLPWQAFLGDAASYFLDVLPIVAAQYLLSLRFANFLAPIGIGFLAWVGALAALSWPHVRLLPYAYPMLDYLHGHPAARAVAPAPDMHALALGWFVLLAVAGYGLFATKANRG